jgi:hypothetical protein
MTSLGRFVVSITTCNLELCHACSFYVVTILYYPNIVCIPYISEHRPDKHFVLYIESYGNNPMSEICLVDIYTTIFYTWEKLFLYSKE